LTSGRATDGCLRTLRPEAGGFLHARGADLLKVRFSKDRRIVTRRVGPASSDVVRRLDAGPASSDVVPIWL
jgi:hypothetical protein